MESSADTTAGKRKRSPSSASQTSSAPAPKVSKTSATPLQINYLARQSQEDLPLINKEDSLPNLLGLLASYTNVLDRHESLASNLGARPLGPILIKRFERCFDAPPKVVASHHKAASTGTEDAQQITWLEVIEFARSHPSQFTLTSFSEGKRVCQFYYPQKQLRVQISEEDFLFINSGRCQELIPPLPIWEDEEKEVATCDVLEAKLKELTNAADMVAARTRQLSHRLKGRRAAILERRAEGGSGTPAKASVQQTTTAFPLPSDAGFTAVNSNSVGPRSGSEVEASLGNLTTVRNDLVRHFESLPHNQGHNRAPPRQHSIVTIPESSSSHAIRPAESNRGNGGVDSTASSLSPVPNHTFGNDPLSYYVTDTPTVGRQPTGTGHRPSSSTGSLATGAGQGASKHNFSRPLPPESEAGQPFRPLCQAHMDSLPRGQRVIPPCDRCRRLRMDCVKNLTSCAGCTRKHARCHWKEVSREELGELDHLMDAAYEAGEHVPSTNGQANGYTNGGGEHGYHEHDDSEDEDDDSNPLEDLEALGEKAEREHEAAVELMRDDEEGVQRAKELARQSWEGSQPPIDKDVAVVTSGDERVEQEHGSRKEERKTDDRAFAFAPLTNGTAPEARAASMEDEDTIEVRAPPRLQAESGSFRAVNETAA